MQQPSLPTESFALIAGKGIYPKLLAEAARKRGVKRIVAIAFRWETDRSITKLADEVHWIYLGQLGHMLEALKASGVREAIMAGQITPTHLFRIRLDSAMTGLLRRLPARNAHTIFGAVGEELQKIGVRLLPASSFMDDHMAGEGLLTQRPPTPAEQADIKLGFRVAHTTSDLDIGQTVVLKDGAILAVEAFEGTNATLRRAGKLAGPGTVVVKTAKPGHDVRFDIPVIGLHTLKILKQIKASVLALEAHRAILLEREKVIAEANRIGLTLWIAPPRNNPETN